MGFKTKITSMIKEYKDLKNIYDQMLQEDKHKLLSEV